MIWLIVFILFMTWLFTIDKDLRQVILWFLVIAGLIVGGIVVTFYFVAFMYVALRGY